MSKIAKPDYSFAKSQVLALGLKDKELTDLIRNSKRLHNEIRDKANGIINYQVEEALRNTSVDQLNAQKARIRVSKLKAVGVNTVWDAYSMNVYQLTCIDGIGEQSAEKISEIARHMESAIRSTMRVRLSLDDKNSRSTALVRACYVADKSAPFIEQTDRLYGAKHAEIARLLKEVKPATSGFRWFFSRKAKKQAAIDALDAIIALLSSDYPQQVDILQKCFNDVASVDDDTVWEAFAKNPIKYNSDIERLSGVSAGEDTTYGLGGEFADTVQNTQVDLTGLTCTLRPYQLFATKYIISQKRVLLGDEMGLGKTVEAIASMVALRNTGCSRFIVVCPVSVITNWCREVENHSNLIALKCYGSTIATSLDEWQRCGGVLVTTYEIIRKFKDGGEYKSDLLVADEAHYAKNPDAQRTKALLSLVKSANYVLYMTGTPLENQLSEMQFLVECLNPKIGQRIARLKNQLYSESFRKAVSGVYFRRKREDVLGELPDLIESEEWLSMGSEEFSAYATDVRSRNFMSMRRVSWSVGNLEKSVKAQRLLEICDEARDEGRKVLVFSFFKNTLQFVADLLGDRCAGVITGSVTPAKRQEMIDSFDDAADGAVLVAQIQAGGTGLNIQSASVVAICEPQVKPSIENQAISRAYRMGQSRNVLVYRLLCEKCVDEHMMERLYSKQSTFDAYADVSESGKQSLALSESGIQDIIEEELRRLDSNGDDLSAQEQQYAVGDEGLLDTEVVKTVEASE